MKSVFVTLILSLSTWAAGADRADEAAVQALVVGKGPPTSFVVEGIVRPSIDGGLAFRVATDGQKQVCALYDPWDGTPMFLSDGQQTLIYDLENSRVVRLPISRGTVNIVWNDKDRRPQFEGWVQIQTRPESLEKFNSAFRIDQLVAALRFNRTELDGAPRSFAAERESGMADLIQKDDVDKSWFRYAGLNKKEHFYSMQLEAKHIGEKIPDSALAFPELKKLAEDVAVTELDMKGMADFLKIVRDGRAWLAKMAICGGPTIREAAEKIMPNTDWDELARRDKDFGGKYREALAKAGVKLPLYKKE
jgi:hypothetical protein